MKRNACFMAAVVALGSFAAGCDEPTPACDPATMICTDAAPADEGPGTDTGPGADTGPRVDAGPCPQIPGMHSGAACRAGACARGLDCQDEFGGSFTGTFNEDGTMGPPLMIRGFPDSMCAEVCDPDAADTCDDCTSCVGTILGGRVRFGISDEVPGTCRPNCSPTTTDRGGCRDGYACDPNTLTCMEACIDDMQCRFRIDDIDDDGDGDIVYAGDSSAATCNPTTGRCNIPGRAGATAGDECMVNADCEDNGLCIQDDETLPDGYCVRLGCADTLPCQTGDVCQTRPFFTGVSSICLDGCTVGAETMDSQVTGSATGGNPECRTGEACYWTGGDTAEGGCFPAEYNDVPAYNVGAPCDDVTDCWSPFGYGRCLFTNQTDRLASGYCVVGNCAQRMGMPIGILPGVAVPTPANVCDTAGGDICVNFGGADSINTFCVPNCTNASECAPGYACPDLGAAGSPLRLCWPTCTMDADCRSGTSCRDEGGGACDPMVDTCYCSDAMPAPVDGGMMSGSDAGMSGSDAGPAVLPDAALPDAGL